MADKDEDILEEAREEFALGEEAWSNEKQSFEDDYRFARMSEQWPIDIKQQRKDEARPCLTINRQPAFIRQVVNDGRQNRPAIKVRPVNTGADQAHAEVMAGLVRHVEAISDADVAYDTALDNACSGGFGFVGVDVDYACDDTFDLDLKITAFPNPLCVTWDPHSTAEDSSDWNFAFVTDQIPLEEFRKKYPKARDDSGDFQNDANIQEWFAEERVRLARYYKRKEITRTILLLSDGQVVDAEKAKDPEFQALMQQMGVSVIRERPVKSYSVTVRLITGLEILEEKEWAGTTIPIVPCWGETLNVKGERFFRSLIHNAKDAQRIHNYSRSTATELVSLAPKVPFIGEDGAFDSDPDKWESINVKSWPYVTFKKGAQPPMRQPFTGVPEGAMNEANAALEDMKQIIGIHDASLGMPGNEISGKAIRYRQHEGDVSTFHFIDNQHRMIRGVGRILLEMIPHIYEPGRIVRIIGQDGKPGQVALGNAQNPQPPKGFERIYDLTAGKYDLAVEAGPSYTTRREEAAEMITSFIQAAPQTAPVLGPMLARMSDWPEADKVSELLATMMPPEAKAIFTGQPMPEPGPPPEVQIKQMEMQANLAMETTKANHQAQLQQQAQASRIQIEREQAMADIAVQRQRAEADMAIERQKTALKMELMREEADLKAQLSARSAANAEQMAAMKLMGAQEGSRPA